MNINILTRKINKTRRYFIINIVGLSLALSSVMLVFSFVKNELSYDRVHSKANRICRITQNTNTGISSMIDARFFTGYFADIKNSFPEVECITGLSSFRKAIVTIRENSFYTEKAFRADSSFFKVFDFELLVGDQNTILNTPGQAAVTESLANKYFGTTDVLGRQIKIVHQRTNEPETYTIQGLLKDFPENSHIKAEILCSFPNDKYSHWAYSYMLVAKNTNIKNLQNKIQKNWDETNKDEDVRPLIELQPLTDIHLKSHKTREMEPGGNINTLILLISGALIILIVALINFINFNYVRFLAEIKNIRIKIVNGASNLAIAKEFLSEVVVLLVFVITFSLIFVEFFIDYLHFDFYTSKPELIVLITLFSLLILSIAFVPMFYRKTRETVRTFVTNKKSYEISLLVQLLLSIVAISSTLFIQKQMNYINKLHPKANDASVIVIPRNPSSAVAKFELLKEQLRKYPEIISACGVSEEPAGTVTDNFAYTYNGDTTGNDKTLNVLIVDEDFFSFMGIKSIAGTVDLGTIPNFEWEQDAIRLWSTEQVNRKVPDGIKEKITSYSEKYIINETALKHIGIKNPKDAIGKEFRINQQLSYLFPNGRIIGVVPDFKYTNVHEKVKPLAIMPRRMFCHNFLFRIDTVNQAKAISLIEKKWNEINEGIPFNYEFITDSYRKVYKNEYMQMRVLMLFAIISILLSLIGMYAMIAFKLKLQTKEIGIRKVNGASVFQIIWMINTDFFKWLAIAFVLAVPVTLFAINRWLENFAYKTGLSWWIFALAGIAILLIIVVTVSLQTFGIARRNPVEALRYE
jgi:putative ABC transport system permease protein